MPEQPPEPAGCCSRNALLRRLAMVGLSAVIPAPAAWAQQTDVGDDLERVRTGHDPPALAAAVVKGGTVIAAAVVGTRIHEADAGEPR